MFQAQEDEILKTRVAAVTIQMCDLAPTDLLSIIQEHAETAAAA
jgi:hypothetical protein